MDPGALGHEREQVHLGSRARTDADHRDPASDRERVEVVRDVRRADELEDDVERTPIAEGVGRADVDDATRAADLGDSGA